jgi:putative ABC transport system permease protein
MMRQRQGAAIGPAASALYVPMALAEKISKRSDNINFINIKLKKTADAAKFRARWASESARTAPAVLIVGAADVKAALDEGMMAENAKKQAWAATGMSLLAALFIIFTTLSMGVNERVRQFAMMRAVGLTRFQVACVVSAESFFLAIIGWGGGLAAGWGLLQVVSNDKPELFGNAPSLGLWCILLTGASALGGALAASIFPAWQATGVEPLEALSPRHPVRPSMIFAMSLAAIGLLLISANPLLVFVATIPDAARYGIYEAIGCSSMAVGFLLLTPMAILLIEHLLGPIFAWILRLQPKLLSSQLGSNMWRTLGTTVALTIGLGLYVAMMVWGYSMLEPFKPGKWVPDVLAAFQLGGLPDGEIEAVRNIPGVIPEQCIPLVVDQPRLAEDITQSQEGNSVTRQDNVIIIGLDPEIAFGGDHPLIQAEFTQGSAAEAIAKLKQGRYCIVPDHFLAATGLHVGDRFSMLPPEKPEKPVEYTIAGAVSLPGWHWMTKFSGLRRRSGRSAAMVFAPYEEVRRDFNINQINFFWMNIDKDVGVDKIGTAMQAIADRNLGEKQPVNGQGTWTVGAQMFGESLRISTPDEVRTRIFGRADAMIWAMCELPLITLLVTSLGVINTIMASVRARRWELGVLRALGVTRGALFRMILVEGLLIGLVACALSLAFGVMAGWCGTGISQYVSFFGGMATPLIVPWSKLALGFSITLALCLAAALWPAISTGRAEPLKLLQEGRTAL